MNDIAPESVDFQQVLRQELEAIKERKRSQPRIDALDQIGADGDFSGDSLKAALRETEKDLDCAQKAASISSELVDLTEKTSPFWAAFRLAIEAVRIARATRDPFPNALRAIIVLWRWRADKLAGKSIQDSINQIDQVIASKPKLTCECAAILGPIFSSFQSTKMQLVSLKTAMSTKPKSDAPTKSESDTPIELESETPSKLESDTPTKPVSDTPSKLESETPTKPVSDTSTKPVSDTPTKPVSDTPSKLESETPTKPVSDTPSKLESETPTKPVSETPSKPESDTPTKPVSETPSKFESETPSKLESDTPIKPASDTSSKPVSDTPSKLESKIEKVVALSEVETVEALIAGVNTTIKEILQLLDQESGGLSPEDNPGSFALVSTYLKTCKEQLQLAEEASSELKETMKLPAGKPSAALPKLRVHAIEVAECSWEAKEWAERACCETRALLCSDANLLWIRTQLKLPNPCGGQNKTGSESQQLEDARLAALKAETVGLAFSGGGIRSATFNLGVLQGLADFRLLKHFDYLSTVSGGGYIGSWFAAWIKRDGSLLNVERQLKPSRAEQSMAERERVELKDYLPVRTPLPTAVPERDEPAPIFHLRAHSNYLSPKLGILSADVWVLIAIYFRNFLLNQAVLLPAFLALLFITRIVFWSFREASVDWWKLAYSQALVPLFVVIAFSAITYSLWRLRGIREGEDKFVWRQLSPVGLRWLILSPLLLGAILVCRLFIEPGCQPVATWSEGVRHAFDCLDDCLAGYSSLPPGYVGVALAGCFCLTAILLAVIKSLSNAPDWMRFVHGVFAGMCLGIVPVLAYLSGPRLASTMTPGGFASGSLFESSIWLGILGAILLTLVGICPLAVGLAHFGSTVRAEDWSSFIYAWCRAIVRLAFLAFTGMLAGGLLGLALQIPSMAVWGAVLALVLALFLCLPGGFWPICIWLVAWIGWVGSSPSWYPDLFERVAQAAALVGIVHITIYLLSRVFFRRYAAPEAPIEPDLLPLPFWQECFRPWIRYENEEEPTKQNRVSAHWVSWLTLGKWLAIGLVIGAISGILSQVAPWLYDVVSKQKERTRSLVLYGLFFGVLHSLPYIYFVTITICEFYKKQLLAAFAPRAENVTRLQKLYSLLKAFFGSSSAGEGFWWLTASFASGVLGGVLLYLLGALIGDQTLTIEVHNFSLFDPAFLNHDEATQTLILAMVVAFGPPAALMIFMLAAGLEVGLMGRSLSESTREWWSSLCGWVSIFAAAYMMVFAVALFGGWLIAISGPSMKSMLATVWAAAAGGGILAGRSSKTGTQPDPRLLDLLAKIAPYVFLLGLLAFLSWLLTTNLGASGQIVEYPKERGESTYKVQVKTLELRPPTKETTEEYTLTRPEWKEASDHYWRRFGSAPIEQLRVGLGLCLALAGFMAWRVDINRFSLHGLYSNRLVRCYLGASRPKAQGDSIPIRGAPIHSDVDDLVHQPNPITGLDHHDDLPLCTLRRDFELSDAKSTRPLGKRYRGPYLLINTALNLVNGEELAWQERKAESFVLSPYYCGSESTGYQSLDLESDHDFTLGNAVTISGAAASPNMGYHSSPAVTALLTIFNVRLGAWMQNPAGVNPLAKIGRFLAPLARTGLSSKLKSYCRWNPTSPPLGLLYLARELFGRTDARSSYLYLSDGGHFENLGVYELIRRRCRYIIACDAGADPHYTFEDLAGLVRKCRSDFGVRIEIDVSSLRPEKPHHASGWHCAIGLIRYDDVDVEAPPGILVYMKCSLTGDEPSDVQNYATANPTFPHQSTLNQFYTESQFESYRTLGEHVVESVFGDVVRQLKESKTANGNSGAKTLFHALRRRWFPPPPNHEQNFLVSAKAFEDLQNSFRSEKDLLDYSRSLYPEIAADQEKSGFVFSAWATSLSAVIYRDFVGGSQAIGKQSASAATSPESSSTNLHMTAQMLQLMENVWLGVHLDGYYAHPLNRGWMNVCRRWTSSEIFRQYWPRLRGEFSKGFVRFCEEQLGLAVQPAYAVRVDPEKDEGIKQIVSALRSELIQEWPRLAGNLRTGKLSYVWLIPAPVLSQTSDKKSWPPNGYACGLIGLFPSNEDRYELLVWLRGPYRGLGIGREALHEPLAEIRNLLAEERTKVGKTTPFTLFVRYPEGTLPGNCERMERAVWLGFFHANEFRRSKNQLNAREKSDLMLERRWPPETRA